MWAYLALFGWSFAAATLLPLGSEPALAALVIAEQHLWLPLLVATVGNVLGSVVTFVMGYQAGRVLASNPAHAARLERATRTLDRWGPLALVLAWIPVLGDVLVTAAGTVRLAPFRCLLWLTIGKAGRYLVVGLTALALTR